MQARGLSAAFTNGTAIDIFAVCSFTREVEKCDFSWPTIFLPRTIFARKGGLHENPLNGKNKI
jgi:hypothetical protein